MIQSAKDAKAIGLAWLRLEFRLPDGSRQEIVGPYSKARALAIFTLAAQDDMECTHIAATNGHGHEGHGGE